MCGIDGKVFNERIEMSDIEQGQLGNCGFGASLCALTKYPNLIKQLFLTRHVSQIGMYRIQLCHDG